MFRASRRSGNFKSSVDYFVLMSDPQRRDPGCAGFGGKLKEDWLDSERFSFLGFSLVSFGVGEVGVSLELLLGSFMVKISLKFSNGSRVLIWQ